MVRVREVRSWFGEGPNWSGGGLVRYASGLWGEPWVQNVAAPSRRSVNDVPSKPALGGGDVVEGKWF